MKKDEEDTDEESDYEQFTWSLVDFNRDFIFLQVEFEEPEKLSQFYSEDNISVTFWGVDFFKNLNNVEVELGTQLVWKV